MNYLVGKDGFTKINETVGTLQNTSKITTVEISDSQEQNSGLLLPPLGKVPLGGSSMFVRCVDGAGAEVRVVPFELEFQGGGSGVGTVVVDGVELHFATDAEIAAMLTNNFGLEG